MATGTFRDERGHEARELFDQGMSCNAIARALRVGAATISRWAKEEGVKFDRSKVDAANKAHTIDLAAARIRLAEKMSAAAEDMLDTIDGPYLVYNFGGKDNDYNEHLLDSAPVEVRRNVITTAGITFDKLTRIVERDSGGLEQAIGTLDLVADVLKDAAAKYQAEGETPNEPE